MVTKIFIKPNHLSEWSQLDLLDDVPVSLNYSISDIRKPETREGNYSKTIRIPGTKLNNELFTDIFEIDIDGTFNPAIKSDVELLIDDVSVFRGDLQLLRVYLKDTNFIDYDVQIIGNTPTLIQELGDKTVSALDFSDLDHAYTYANVSASWTPTIGTGYVYPLINYDQTATNLYTLTDFVPAIFAKEYWDRIMELAGYTYKSDFITDTYFKSLIIPYSGNGLRLTNADVEDRTFRASLTGFYQTPDLFPNLINNPTTKIVPFDDDTTAPNFDTGGNFNTASGRFVPVENGSYKLNCQLNLQSLWYNAGILVNTSNTYVTQLQADDVALVVGDYVDVRIKLFWGVSVVGFGVTTQVQFVKNGTTVINTGTVTVDQSTPVLVVDEVKLRVLATSLYFNGVATDTITEGMTMLMNNALPPADTKLRDILVSFIRMFNLYIEVDPDNPKNILVEPRYQYYQSGANRTLDWTDKLDESQDMVITPMGELDSKSFLFTYKEDKDYYNEKYQKNNDEVYGKFEKFIDNDFSKNQSKIDVIFSPTPLVGNTQSNRIIPHIYQFDEQNNTIQRKATNIRILYWGGLLTSTPSYIVTSNVPTSVANILNKYPYAGHLDNPYSPNVELNWGNPNELFYGYNAYIAPPNLEYTSNSLYNKFYKDMIEELSDSNSKLVTCYLRLTPEDVEFLSFRKIYVIKGYYLRLQKIEDYNPLSNQLTKCEFLKIKDGQSFQVTKETIIGGIGSSIGGMVKPGFVVDGKPLTGEVLPGKIIRFGQGGFLDASSVQLVVNGDGNSVHANCMRIMIEGENNTVYANSSGVVVFGDSNVLEGNNENVTLLNSSGVTVQFGVSGVTTLNLYNQTITQSGLYLNNPTIIDSGGDVTLDLDDTSIFLSNTLTIPTQYSTQNKFILTGASASYEVTRILNIPVVDFRFTKGGSITSLKFTSGAFIYTPGPSTFAQLDGTSNDYIIFRKSGIAVKQLEVNVY
jgi:hypothetical protein